MRFLIYVFFVISAPILGQPLDKSQKSAQKDFEKGRELLENEEYQEAIEYLDSSIRKRPYEPEPYFLRALAKAGYLSSVTRIYI